MAQEKEVNDSGKAVYGGTCLNVGCIPSKSLLDSSHRYHDAKKHLEVHGIDIPNLNLNLKKMMDRKNKIVSQLTGGITGLLTTNKVTPIKVVLLGRIAHIAKSIIAAKTR